MHTQHTPMCTGDSLAQGHNVTYIVALKDTLRLQLHFVDALDAHPVRSSLALISIARRAATHQARACKIALPPIPLVTCRAFACPSDLLLPLLLQLLLIHFLLLGSLLCIGSVATCGSAYCVGASLFRVRGGVLLTLYSSNGLLLLLLGFLLSHSQ